MALQAPRPVLRRREKPRGATCLNCHEEIESRFCPHCGQENIPADLTLFAVLKEFFNEIFYYDSKMWRTLRTLLFHPGRLSREWSQGRRATFLSPIRLYLTITFLFFVAAAWKGGASVSVTRSLSPQDLKELVAQLHTKTWTPTELGLVKAAVDKTKKTPEKQRELDDAFAYAEKRAESPDNGPLISHSRFGPNSWFGRQITKIETAAKDKPNELQRLYIDQFPKVLFIVLPLFAVVLKLLYVRQRRFFVEHLVFILHLHSFAFLVFLPLILIPSPVVSEVITPLVLLLWFPIYAFVAMLRFYTQPWWLTLIKGLVLNTAYLLLLAGGALLGLVFTAYKLDDAPASTPAKPAVTAPATPSSS